MAINAKCRCGRAVVIRSFIDEHPLCDECDRHSCIVSLQLACIFRRYGDDLAADFFVRLVGVKSRSVRASSVKTTAIPRLNCRG